MPLSRRAFVHSIFGVTAASRAAAQPSGRIAGAHRVGKR